MRVNDNDEDNDDDGITKAKKPIRTKTHFPELSYSRLKSHKSSDFFLSLIYSFLLPTPFLPNIFRTQSSPFHSPPLFIFLYSLLPFFPLSLRLPSPLPPSSSGKSKKGKGKRESTIEEQRAGDLVLRAGPRN